MQHKLIQNNANLRSDIDLMLEHKTRFDLSD